MASASNTRIGEQLSLLGYIGEAELNDALQAQRIHPAPLGTVLHAHRAISARQLAEGVAAQQALPLVWLDASPPNRSLFHALHTPLYLHYHYVPHHRDDTHLILATAAPSEALIAWATEFYGQPIALKVTSPRDLAQCLQRYGAEHYSRLAKHRLRRLWPTLSASRTLTTPQARALTFMASTLGIFIALTPETAFVTLLWVCNVFYLFTLCFKALLFHIGRHIASPSATELPKDGLPLYSILVPLYREPPTVVRALIDALEALDYPAHCKEVFLLCEADDAATLAAVKAANPPSYCRIFEIPPSSPRTKPKACNLALPFLTGEFVVIFDAEDRPHPQQLRRAVAEFRRSDTSLACLQAPLNYYNREETILTRLFSLEYSSLFCLQLPAIEALGIPMPLGGTSNHVRREALMHVGGWDAFNVTEDADLGMRLAYFGYRTQMLPSLTLEEAPLTLRAWMKQRSRWIKGYIQTWLVYMREPDTLKKRLGARGYYGFQFFVGAPALTFFLAPFFWLAFGLAALGVIRTELSPALMACCLFTMAIGALSHWLYAREAIARENWHSPRMRIAGIVYPFYWLLHSVASFMAVWQLLWRPHHWEKTTHGMSRIFTPATKETR